MPVGRFAPSPSGALHVGSLRTALVAWLAARSGGSRFLLRSEDLDPSGRPHHERSQQRDLRALGLGWDGVVVRQSERRELYDDAISQLVRAGLTYPCFCTRREIHEATQAPHGNEAGLAYPGTCRDLTNAQRRERAAAGRPPALRLRAGSPTVEVLDTLHGRHGAVVDDLVLRRNDGLPAYNLAVVVDDADQGVEEVVRGDDLLASTPRQVHLARLLGLTAPAYLHVPLVVGSDGTRLAKRHGSITLYDLLGAQMTPAQVRAILARSLGLAGRHERPSLSELATRLDRGALPREPWAWPLGSGTGRQNIGSRGSDLGDAL